MDSKKYWLYGGLWSLPISSFLIVILILLSFSAHDIGDSYGPVVESVTSLISAIYLINPLSNAGFSFLESIFIIIPYTFLAGSMIGWLYGKYTK